MRHRLLPLVLLVLGIAACSDEGEWPDREAILVDPGPGPSAGSGDIVLLEYGSLGCEACRRFFVAHLPALRSTTDVEFEYLYRESLVHKHGGLLRLAVLTQCAGELVGYWRAHSWVLASPDTITTRPASWTEAIDRMASGLDIEPEALAECVADSSREARLMAASARADSIGVRAVPTFVIGVRRHDGSVAGWPIRGLAPLDTLRTYLKAARSAADP